MSSGWSFYIAIITVINILACLWLLWWTRKKRPATMTGDEPGATTGHIWDEDLTEYNKPLPKWWLNLFYITIVFGVIYLILFPGLGAFGGTQNWSSEGKHAADVALANQKLRELYARFDGIPMRELAAHPEAIALGRSVFANHCAQCHGSDARGARGFPNLVDADWIWGDDPDTVLASVSNGRIGVMPAWGPLLGEQGVTEVSVYVQSLAGLKVDASLGAAGKARFTLICAACHGADGKGNQALGASNLTDEVWLYGGDFAAIAEGVRNGRNGVMPAQLPLIGGDRSRLATAWLLAQQASAPAADPAASTNSTP